jgi:hypothetical protein
MTVAVAHGKGDMTDMTDERQTFWRRGSRLMLVGLLVLSAGLAGCGEMDDDDNGGYEYEEEDDD